MNNIRGKKQFKILIFVLIAVITLGIGYAGITAINLVVNGTGSAPASQDNFKVHFTEAQAITGSTGAAMSATQVMPAATASSVWRHNHLVI